jgi:hypothetical protein
MVIAMATTRLEMSVVLDSWDMRAEYLENDSRLMGRPGHSSMFPVPENHQRSNAPCGAHAWLTAMSEKWSTVGARPDAFSQRQQREG